MTFLNYFTSLVHSLTQNMFEVSEIIPGKPVQWVFLVFYICDWFSRGTVSSIWGALDPIPFYFLHFLLCIVFLALLNSYNVLMLCQALCDYVCEKRFINTFYLLTYIVEGKSMSKRPKV